MAEYELIDPRALAQTLHEMLEENVEHNEGVMRDDIRHAAKLAEDELHTASPKLTGHHAEGWRTYFDQRISRGIVAQATVAATVKPSLTHLLEFGHIVVARGKQKKSKKRKKKDQDPRHSDSHRSVGLGGRTKAFYYIRDAYNTGARYLEGVKVDNP